MSAKTLFLLRHAKAITGGLLVPDQDRPLSERGLKDINKLGVKLHQKEVHLDLLVTSNAIRAITTAHSIANKLEMKHANFLIDPSVYGAEMTALLELISRIPKRYDDVMIVGHNPSLTELASHIAGEPIAMSTCSLMKASFEFKDWAKVLTEKSSKFSFLN
jgi:phosphohistidine phosphatase